MPDHVVALLMLCAWAHGFLMAWAWSRQDDPFWYGFVHWMDPSGFRRDHD
jgi:hypothetical protein